MVRPHPSARAVAARSGKADGWGGAGLVEALEQRAMFAVDVVNPLGSIQRFWNMPSVIETIDLAGRYDNPAINGSVVRFQAAGTYGTFFVELFNSGGANQTPLNANNFLQYANAGRYDNTVIHRSVPGFVIQAGGFGRPLVDGTLPIETPTFAPVTVEGGTTHARGTIGAARTGSFTTGLNTATGQFFFNTTDNFELNATTNAMGEATGGYTAFGRVLGSGMTVVDALAAVPAPFGDNLPSPFDELPLNYTSGLVRASNFIGFEDVSATSEIVSYSVVSNTNQNLVQATIVNGQIRLLYAPNATGAATLTIRATSADGTFVDDTLAITVGEQGARPNRLDSNVSTVRRDGSLPLFFTPAGATINGQAIAAVEFWRDRDGNGTLETGTDQILIFDGSGANGYAGSPLAASFALGVNRFFARVILANNTAVVADTLDVTVTSTPPTIASLTTPTPVVVQAGNNLTLTANSARDPDGTTVARVRFYRDTNNNGLLDVADDTQVGVDDVAGNGFAATFATTGFTTQTMRFFAVAEDVNGVLSAPVSTLVRINGAPTVGSVSSPFLSTPRGSTALIEAENVSDERGIRRVDFYRDSNGNGTFDVTDRFLGSGRFNGNTGAYEVQASTAGFALGVNTIFARAVDTDGLTGPARTGVIQIVNNNPVVQGLTASVPTIATPGLPIRLTAVGVRDIDGTVARVRFWRDVNNNGALDAGDGAAIGEDTLASGGYTLQLTGADTAGLVPGNTRYFARVEDNDGGSSFVVSTVVRVNAPPAIGLGTVTAGPIPRGFGVRLEAIGVTDDAGIRGVQFFLDADNDGVVDPTERSLGNASFDTAERMWALLINSSTLGVGTFQILGVATDSQGVRSAVSVLSLQVTA